MQLPRCRRRPWRAIPRSSDGGSELSRPWRCHCTKIAQVRRAADEARHQRVFPRKRIPERLRARRTSMRACVGARPRVPRASGSSESGRPRAAAIQSSTAYRHRGLRNVRSHAYAAIHRVELRHALCRGDDQVIPQHALARRVLRAAALASRQRYISRTAAISRRDRRCEPAMRHQRD